MEQPLSLYLKLEEGQVADLEVVAKAALAFVAAVTEVAFVLDPGLDLSIGFPSATEGSLSLNGLIRTARNLAPDRATLKAIGLVVLGWFANDGRGYLVGEGINIVRGKDHLSQEEIEQIAAQVERINKGKVGQKAVRQIYSELRHDRSITGVGATVETGIEPAQIVPKSEFDLRAAEAVVTRTPRKRSKDTPERVTLIAPVLLPRERSWKLWLPNIGEFWAKMKDEKFLEGLASGRRKIPMQPGVQMEVILTTHEENTGEVWEIKDREVKKVGRVRRPTNASTADLLASLKEDDADDK
jgi:hypothetical protein